MTLIPPPPPPEADPLDAVLGGFADAWRRMVALLFEPPRASAMGWLTWGGIILLAGLVEGGGPGGLQHTVSDDGHGSLGGLEGWPWLLPLALFGLALALGLALLWLYVTARFRFVLLEGVRTGEPRIRGVFGRTAPAGGAYFLAQLGVYGALLLLNVPVFALWIPAVRAAFSHDVEPALHVLVPMIATVGWTLPLGFVACVLLWWLYDVVLPYAWSGREGFLEGLRQAWALTRSRPGTLLLLACGRLLLALAGALFGCVVACITCVVWIWPLLIMLALLVPSAAFPPLLLVTGPLILGCGFVMAWIIATAMAPLPILERSWSWAVLARLDPELARWDELA